MTNLDSARSGGLDALAQVIASAEASPLVLVTALPGSGMTTALDAVAHDVRQATQRRCIRVDAAACMPARARLSVPAILTTMLARLRIEAPEWASPLDTLFWRRLPELQLEGAEPWEHLARWSLQPDDWHRAFDVLGRRRTEVVDLARDVLAHVEHRARRAGEGLLLVLDGLEGWARFDDRIPDWLPAAHGVFGPARPWLRLPVPFVCTAPLPAVWGDPTVHALTMVQVDRPEGVEALRALVHQRIAPAIEEAIFKSPQVLDELLRASGGHLGTLSADLDRLLAHARQSGPLSADQVRHHLATSDHPARRLLSDEARARLMAVHAAGHLSLDAFADRHLRAAVAVGALCWYRNGEDRFVVQPRLVSEVK